MITGFSPIAAPNAEVLILGSMPGQASLDATEYYAHPRNAFWPIICRLFASPEPDHAELSYAERLALITVNRIALWDVMQRCVRKGSLDSAIEKHSIVANDFVTFFENHSAIRWVFFNGGEAERSFKRHVLPQLSRTTVIEAQRLPSTSPAHASMTLMQKFEQWQRLRDVMMQ